MHGALRIRVGVGAVVGGLAVAGRRRPEVDDRHARQEGVARAVSNGGAKAGLICALRANVVLVQHDRVAGGAGDVGGACRVGGVRRPRHGQQQHGEPGLQGSHSSPKPAVSPTLQVAQVGATETPRSPKSAPQKRHGRSEKSSLLHKCATRVTVYSVTRVTLVTEFDPVIWGANGGRVVGRSSARRHHLATLSRTTVQCTRVLQYVSAAHPQAGILHGGRMTPACPHQQHKLS